LEELEGVGPEGMRMTGMVRFERRGVREAWKVMLESNIAASDESVAVWFYSSFKGR
jgi:hypothetical protein